MGFEGGRIGGDIPSPISGVMDLSLPNALAEACVVLYTPADIKGCMGKAKVMPKKNAGQPKMPMPAELYVSMLM